MARSVRDALCDALKDLRKEDLKSFRNKLNDWDIEGSYKKIPRGELQDKDAEDVVDLIRDYYTLSYGARLTVKVLIAINQRQVAMDLQEDLDRVNGSGRQGESMAAPSASGVNGAGFQENTWGAASSAEDEEPFVDRHRKELIDTAYSVDAVLDSLMEMKLLKYEEYNAVRAEGTSQEKMRKLYEYINGWGNEDKEKVYDALKEHMEPLIRHLESR